MFRRSCHWAFAGAWNPLGFVPLLLDRNQVWIGGLCHLRPAHASIWCDSGCGKARITRWDRSIVRHQLCSFAKCTGARPQPLRSFAANGYSAWSLQTVGPDSLRNTQTTGAPGVTTTSGQQDTLGSQSLLRRDLSSGRGFYRAAPYRTWLWASRALTSRGLKLRHPWWLRMRPAAKRVTIEGMSWKGAFTVFLTAILLSASCWASVCDVACTVPTEAGCPVCRSIQHEHSHDTMSHGHCAHLHGTKHNHVSLVTADSTCVHAFCRLPDSLVDRAIGSQSDKVQWTVIHQAPILDRAIAQVRFVSEAAPPDIVSSISPLSIALRI